MPPRKQASSSPPLAYSYLRFSSPEQAKGDSIRRQTEARDAWVKRNGAVLDKSLTLEDRGVSGFTGKHAEDADKYALARFLELVEQGKVPRGSYLLIENLDRLSRQSLRLALTLLLNLINRGIRVVQLSPTEQVFDENAEPMTLMIAVMELNRGHSESAMKSERIGKAWGRKKEAAAASGAVMTPIVPGWLRVDGGKIVPVPDRANVVRRIFADLAAGRGITQIARALTREGCPRWGAEPAGSWQPAYIHKIAVSRAVLGEYQPRRRVGKQRLLDGEAVPGYYPAVVTPAEWQAAQESLRSRHLGSGKTVAKHWNPFAGWLLDARDGAPMRRKVELSQHDALVNSTATKGAPDAVYCSFPFEPFATAVLSQLREVKPADIAPGGPGSNRVAELTDRRTQLLARIETLRTELESGDGEVKAAVTALRKMEGQLEELTADLSHARSEAPEQLAESWANARSLIELLEKSPDPEETRVRLKSVLRRVIAEGRVLIVARCRRPRKDGKGGQQPRYRLAAVQFFFRSGAVRSYLLCYSPAHKRWGKESSCEVRSFAAPHKAGEFDLRDPKHVANLAAELEAVDLEKPSPKATTRRAKKGR